MRPPSWGHPTECTDLKPRKCDFVLRCRGMPFALVHLDTGLFLEKDGWTHDHKLALHFTDEKSICDEAAQRNLKNAAAAFIEGNPPQVRGFCWITSPTPNQK
jgi:hypothetical protein